MIYLCGLGETGGADVIVTDLSFDGVSELRFLLDKSEWKWNEIGDSTNLGSMKVEEKESSGQVPSRTCCEGYMVAVTTDW
jgi:hypothetical protein